MAERLGEIKRRILIVSFFAIMVLAIVRHLSADQATSLFAVFLIILIALANIGYIYGRFRKREK
ncbi:MAG: hypothetical protein V1850_07470 [Candidatus Bathyarchaeota archaeon]